MKWKLTENKDISGSPERNQRKLPPLILNQAELEAKTPDENKSSPIKYTLLKFYVDDFLIHGIVIIHNNDRLIIPQKYFHFNKWVNSINQFFKAVWARRNSPPNPLWNRWTIQLIQNAWRKNEVDRLVYNPISFRYEL